MDFTAKEASAPAASSPGGRQESAHATQESIRIGVMGDGADERSVGIHYQDVGGV